jgi:signal transduction histidine kinase
MITMALKFMDWFIPNTIRAERFELSVWRNFVFTHLAGPMLSQSISVFLYKTDPKHGLACWTMVVCVSLFWALPFILKYSRNLQLSAAISVQLLIFTSLFGAFNYGGVSSPFMPWLMVSVLLGFFYLYTRPWLVLLTIATNISVFIAAYMLWGFSEIVPLEQLKTVGWISILSATTYMAWMAIFYANIMSTRSGLERESERHRQTASQLLATKQAADSANRSKSIFLAKMSHELRTPLNAVIGYSELLLEDLGDSAPATQKKLDLDRIRRAGKHLLSLVNDVIDIAKIESDTLDLRVEKFNLADLLADIVSTCAPLIAVKGNHLIVDCPPQTGDVESDPTKLRQVLLNLVSNSAKFTKGGRITVTARRERRADGAWVSVSVADTGIGISPAEMPRLFNNFAQASAETANKYGGSGLGLAICKRYSALMGGDISVASEVGAGANFTISIPVRVPMNREDAAPPKPAPQIPALQF